jgi:hypothetical protein
MKAGDGGATVDTERAEIWCATHRGAAPECARAMRDTGFRVNLIEGVSDTALARNLTLTRAVARCSAEVVIMCDDDMVFEPGKAHKLAELALRLDSPVSGLYVLKSGHSAAWPYKPGADWQEARWLTGLGFLAIPLSHLRALAEKSIECDGRGTGDPFVTAFCWSGPRVPEASEGRDGAYWESEDYCLTRRLGGVVLAPMGVGHLKFVPLVPSLDSIAEVERGRVVGQKEKVS